MLSDEIEALTHEAVDLEELRGDENGDCVLDVKLWAAVLHDSRVGKVVLFVVILAGPVVDRVTNSSIEFVLFSVLLLILLHREDVVEQPFEDNCIAVDRDVDFVVVRDLLQTSVEVLHVLD